MPRLTGNYFNFIGGLNTESSVLNADPTSVTSMNNCRINRDGSIQTREGLNSIDTLSIIPVVTSSHHFEGLEWRYNDNYVQVISSKNNLVLLEGKYPNTLLNQSITFTSLDRAPEFTINKNLIYFPAPADTSQIANVDFDDIKGTINTDVILYRDNDQTFTVTATANNKASEDSVFSPTLSGWVTLTTNTGTDVKTINCKILSHTTSAGITTYTFDTTDLVIGDVYDVAYSEIYTQTDDISSLVYAQNRLFIVTDVGDIYYSQTNTINKCYVEANPFSADDNAVVATDGGVIRKTGIGVSYKIVEMFGGLFIFADNGVWQLTGQDGVFAAGELILRKIFEYPVLGIDSIKEVDGGIIFSSTRGIIVITKSDAYSTDVKLNNISDEKIKSYWNSLSTDEKNTTNIVYDDVEGRIYVFIQTEDKVDTFNFCLVYDLLIQAWYTFSFDLEIDGAYVTTIETIPPDNVYYGATDTDLVVTDSGDEVVVSAEEEQGNRQLILLKDDDIYVFNYNSLLDGDTYTFSSSFGSAHQTYKDLFRKKTPSYMKVLFERSESDIDDEYGRDITKGSCKLRTSLNFANDPLLELDRFGQEYISNNDWGRFREIYPRTNLSTSIRGNKSRGYSHLSYSHKLLGRGDALQFTFKNEPETKYYIVTDVSTTTNPRSLNGWEECTAEEDGSFQGAWSAGTYTEGQVVSVDLNSRFKILGWACDIIASEKGSRGQ